ncbi:MAG: NADH-quinone oxidoreductase subunit H, partial [Candidatus Omnitrophica bacterium]|nr:NADH-quinone oxidoreductase subunit H [Candidatus Omnitrophota bacterium]
MIIIAIIQLVFLIAIAPLVSGVIAKIKNNLRMRQGPGVLQPYCNLAKLFAKDEVVSLQASWIFKVAPFVVIASSVMGCLVVPFFLAQ